MENKNFKQYCQKREGVKVNKTSKSKKIERGGKFGECAQNGTGSSVWEVWG